VLQVTLVDRSKRSVVTGLRGPTEVAVIIERRQVTQMAN
jgi:hypothetical protein